MECFLKNCHFSKSAQNPKMALFKSRKSAKKGQIMLCYSSGDLFDMLNCLLCTITILPKYTDSDSERDYSDYIFSSARDVAPPKIFSPAGGILPH